MKKNIIISTFLIALSLISCSKDNTKDDERMEIPEDLVFNPIWVTGLYEGGDRWLYPWKGEHVMLLSYSKDLDRGTMQTWVGWCDKIYEFYNECTGSTREGGPEFDGCLPIIQYRGTGAAAVAWVGGVGIYMEVEYFDGAYKAVQEGYCWGLNAYEMGRNFWSYYSKLGDEPWCTGFSVYFESAALEAKGIPDKNEETREAYTEYMNTPGARFDNTLGQNIGIGGWSSNSLFAAFCLKLMDTFGDKWTYNVWKQVGARPDAQNDQERQDNFIIASSIAAGYDLCDLFEYWRWNVSDNAKDIIKGYGFPVFNPSGL